MTHESLEYLSDPILVFLLRFLRDFLRDHFRADVEESVESSNRRSIWISCWQRAKQDCRRVVAAVEFKILVLVLRVDERSKGTFNLSMKIVRLGVCIDL
jgi:hypothetical protein